MRRSVRILTILALIAVLLAIGCAPKAAVVGNREVESAPAQPAAADKISQATAAGGAPIAVTDLSSAADRMIIQTVDMVIVVEDTDATLALIRQMVAEKKGYIAESSRWITDEQPYARVTFRLPAESLTTAVEALEKAALRVENENSSGQDVTEEFVDVQARVRNLEATETELLALMTEVRENRGKAEDILAIYREITSVRAQIESLKGRQQYLERMSALATVNVEIRPKQAPRSVVEKAKWSPLVTAASALHGFVQVFQVLADVVIWILILSPFVLGPVLVIWLIARAAKRGRARRKARAAAEAEAQQIAKQG